MRTPSSGNPTNITYLPGVARPTRVTEGNLMAFENLKNKRWWLYARSELEANWLDRYGYPTPTQEEWLEKSSDADLTALVAAGDLNAKVIQAVRETKKLFLAGAYDQMQARASHSQFIMAEGGPYQALATMRGYGDLLQTYSDLPEEQKTEAARKALRDLDVAQQIASGFLLAYGDREAQRVAYHMLGIILQQSDARLKAPDLPATSVMNAFAGTARLREYDGKPPLVVVPRPFPPFGKSESKMIYERY